MKFFNSEKEHVFEKMYVFIVAIQHLQNWQILRNICVRIDTYELLLHQHKNKKIQNK